MSDTAQGPGWWLASDGRWYPPELWTGRTVTEPAAVGPSRTPTRAYPGPTPAHEPGSTSPAYGHGAWSAYPSNGIGQHPQYDATIAPKTNGLAIGSLICSCAGLFFLPAVAGIVLGFVARAQIKRFNGAQRGDGLAVAGIIVGFGWLVLFALGIALGARNTTSSGIISSMLAGPCCGTVGPYS